MYLQFDARRCSTGFRVICWLHCVLIAPVNCSECQFILPSLPETPYTLNDVIILPENEDYVETSFVSTETASSFATINVSLETGFRIDNEYNVMNHHASIEKGVRIVTTNKATVVIQLASGLLHLPSFSNYANKYYTFTVEGSLDINYGDILFIQPQEQCTSVGTCLHNYEANEIGDESITYSHEFPWTHKCIRKNISTSEILLLNKTSNLLHGIKIVSNHPISTLEGRRINLSNLARNGRDFNTSKTSVLPISWHFIRPYRDWSNQFVLIPSEEKREVELWIMSLENTTVDIITDDEVIHRKLKAAIPSNISVSVTKGIVTKITGNCRFALNCIDSNAINCNEDIVPVNVAKLNNSTSYDSVNKSNEYKWIYISKGSTITVLCPMLINVSLYSLNGTAVYDEEIIVNISNQFLLMKTFRQSPDGVYKLLLNDSLHLCSMSHSNRKRFYSNSNLETNESTSRVFPYSHLNSLNILGDEPTISTDTDVLVTSNYFNNLNTNPEADTAKESFQLPVGISSSVENITEYWLVEGKELNISASLASVEHVSSTTKYQPSSLKTENVKLSPSLTLQNTTFTSHNRSEKLNDVLNKSNENALKGDPNDRFRAVVDIITTRNGTVNMLLSKVKKSHNRNIPTYIYRLDINNKYDQAGDGKSPLAVIVSLVSALLAVGAIILIFLLKEFFSRRQQIRNTRIRPFISHY